MAVIFLSFFFNLFHFNFLLFLPFVKVFPHFLRFPFISMTIITIIRYVTCKFGRTLMCKYRIVHDIYHVTFMSAHSLHRLMDFFPTIFIALVRKPSATMNESFFFCDWWQTMISPYTIQMDGSHQTFHAWESKTKTKTSTKNIGKMNKCNLSKYLYTITWCI